jgi:hypothetical protein
MDANAPGGAALDLTTEKDRGMVRSYITRSPRRWRGVTEAIKDRCVQQINIAMDEVESIDEPGLRVQVRMKIATTLAMIEGQNQKDDHAEQEADKPAAGNVHIHFTVPPPRVIGES